jgi:outer membrane scaffolding protein for murein synthesis (MipA/OmpV family)
MRFTTSVYEDQYGESDLVPLYLYEGDYLYAHGTRYGAHLFRNEHFELNLEAKYDFGELQVDGDDAFYDTVEERDQTWEGGVTAAVKGDWGQLKLAWYTDLESKHSGNEVQLNYRYRFDIGNWMISPYVTGVWQDSNIANYYYGVSVGESRPDLPAYSITNAFNLEFGVNTWYQFTPRTFIFGNFAITGLDEQIVDSPLVAEETASAVFVGAGYLFGDDKPKRYGGTLWKRDWSWRVNYGYQADENIFPYIMTGDISHSKEVDTEIAGFTIGRLFQGGDRAEFWGKLSYNRHLENPGQDNFASYSAYMMAIGKGYSPWSKQLAFRYGFGFGINYAQEVPLAEQIKQARKGEKTSRLLNYLEFMIDFPVDRLIKSKLTRNCFLGLTVMHRSGIFGTSDVLGSVAGGSDWVTLSYECVR